MSSSIILQGCPSMCKCVEENDHVSAYCTAKNRDISYIPSFPHFVNHISFRQKSFKNVTRHTFINITSVNITELTLSDNQIEHIQPDAFKDFPYLTSIDLSQNPGINTEEISKIFPFFSYKLDTLSLKKMQWTTLPNSTFEGLAHTRLNYLNLMNNKITYIDKFSLLGLDRLQTLRLAGNNLYNINVSDMKYLKYLDLTNNRLLYVPNFCTYNESLLKNLEKLYLSKNLISLHHPLSWCLDSLKELTLDSNPISILPDHVFASLHSLEILRMQKMSRLIQISAMAFNITSLKTLKFSSNNFKFLTNASFIPETIFKYCPNLEVLKLSRNSLDIKESSFKRMLKPLQKLRVLVLYSTGITKLPTGTFRLLPNLEYLDMGKNSITGWDSSVFYGLHNLKVLILEKNRITSINESSFPSGLLSNLQALRIRNNPFSCTCDQEWFGIFVSKSNITVNSAKLSCQSPSRYKGHLLLQYIGTEMSRDCFGYVVVITVPSVVSISLVVVVILIYKLRWNIRYWVYMMRTKNRSISSPSQEELLQSNDYKYDAFVIYCDSDMNWVHNVLLSRLETEVNLRLCIHFRDFTVGKLIVDNIDDCLRSSRKIIVVISPALLNSEWCMFEVRLAQSIHMKGFEDKLLLVMLEDIDFKRIPTILKLLIRNITYLKWMPSAIDRFFRQLISTINNKSITV